jgi:hypothetical protein
MGRHPVAVVISHITYARTMKVDYSRFSWGGLLGKHVVATVQQSFDSCSDEVCEERRFWQDEGFLRSMAHAWKDPLAATVQIREILNNLNCK